MNLKEEFNNFIDERSIIIDPCMPGDDDRDEVIEWFIEKLK